MKYDAIIIGAGQAGIPLGGKLSSRGWKIALAEGGKIGGTCVNYGCSPSKTMIASARAAHVARRGADFGVQTGEIRIDFAKVMARKDRIVEQFNKGVTERITQDKNVTLYRAYAHFTGSKQVAVGDEVIEADRIYINTGARPSAPPIPGLDQVDYLDNESILNLKTLPQHLVIIGGGYIALEYAQAFRRFGSTVTIIEKSGQIMSREDHDIAETALQILEGEGIQVCLNSQVSNVSQRNGGITVRVKESGKEQEISGSHLLVAAGRKPNSDRLALDKAGIQTDAHGFIVVDDHLQTSVEGIWALGDVNGRGAFTHTSYNDYEIIADNLDGGQRSLAERIPAYAVYIDPPLGRVGMSENEVRESKRKALIGVKPMRDIARAKERDETLGLIKVLVDAESQKFLGAAVLGIGGDEIIHTLIDFMYADAPYTVMKNAVHIHPTVSELIPTLLGELKPLPA